MQISQHAVNGVIMNVRDGLYRKFDRGIVEEVNHEYWWGHIPPETKTAIDIGAHIGAWTRRLLHRCPQARVVAVEPEASNHLMLQLNTFGYNVNVINGAVMYRKDEVGLLVAEGENSGGHRLAPGGIEIPNRITLEEIIDQEGFATVDVLKLDCEGSEFDILLKAKSHTMRKIRIIVGEYHSTRDEFDGTVGNRLTSYGFSLQYHPLVSHQGMFLAKRL